MTTDCKLNYLSVLGYGDALVSLMLLEQAVPDPAGLCILGSEITRDVQAQVTGTRFQVEVLLPGHAAFFRLRNDPPLTAVSELFRINQWCRANLRSNDTVMTEKSDWRYRLVLAGSRARLIQPCTGHSIYEDRQQMISAVTGTQIQLEDCRRLASPPRKVLINPASRVPEKALSAHHVEALTTVLHAQRAKITLLDPDSTFGHSADSYDRYLGRIPLADAIQALRDSDLYIGADSFFIHLAYYFRIPFITITPSGGFDFYFAPPGCRKAGNQLTMDDLAKQGRLETTLAKLIAN